MATLSTPALAARPVYEAPAAVRLWHLTSLDAPTVAAVWTLAFAGAAGVRLPWWPPAVLFLSAWSFYLGDRLMDARSATTPLRARHHFHWRYRRVFVPLAVVVGLTALGMVLHFMPAAVRERDSLLAAATMLYFTSVHLPGVQLPGRTTRPRMLALPRLAHPPKELLVGILFTAACAVPAWTRSAGHRAGMMLPGMIFICLAWLNCYAIEAWEARSGLGSKPGPEPGCEPRSEPVQLRAGVLAGVALVSAAAAGVLHEPVAAWLLMTAAMAAGLIALLDRQRGRLTATTLRAAADLALLTPVLLLPLRMIFRA